jgi:hypothetical protein
MTPSSPTSRPGRAAAPSNSCRPPATITATAWKPVKKPERPTSSATFVRHWSSSSSTRSAWRKSGGGTTIFTQRALAAWQDVPQIELLGSAAMARLPIFSFRIGDGKGGYVHQQLVTRMLSDRFGIQARGGCACAGPYVHRLLSIDPETSERIRQAILERQRDREAGLYAAQSERSAFGRDRPVHPSICRAAGAGCGLLYRVLYIRSRSGDLFSAHAGPSGGQLCIDLTSPPSSIRVPVRSSTW